MPRGDRRRDRGGCRGAVIASFGWAAGLQLGIGSLWGSGAVSLSGRYPEHRPSGLPPPYGVVAQRRLLSEATSEVAESKDPLRSERSSRYENHPARASGGLHLIRSNCFQRLGSAIATLGIVRNDVHAGRIWWEQCQGWHVRPSALRRSGWVGDGYGHGYGHGIGIKRNATGCPVALCGRDAPLSGG